MTLRRRGAVAVTLVVAAPVLAGCATLVPGPAQFGADGGGSKDVVCAPTPVGGQLLFGQSLQAPPDSEVTVVEVRLDEPEGVRLVDAVLFPIDPEAETSGIGVGSVPLDYEVDGWDERVDAAGAVVDAGEVAEIAVQVERTSEADAGFASIHLVYDVDHIRYEKSATTSYQLKDSCL